MQYIRDFDEKAYEYLANIAPAQWTRSHFTTRALTDCLVNNLNESFNAMILKSRDKPILAMLEWIRVRLMTRLYTKREGIQKYTRKLCPSIQDRLEKLKVESKPFSATPAGNFLYEVGSQYERHIVDLVKKTCSCRSWDLNGIPCKHAITAIYINIETPKDHTYPCYFKETYMEIYKEVLPPMSGLSEKAKTGQPAPLAPHIYKPLGRPPKQSKRASDEPRNPYKASRLNRPIRCGKCKKERHNSKGCKAGITGETPWQWRQRLQREKAISKGRGACTSACTPATIPATYPDLQHDVYHSAFILTLSHANRSTGGVRTRGQLAAQRPPKMNSVGGKRKE
ncbi:uncharacterized protein LOC115970348 [Quercus lobata]|uniref:uncharacterized protein LOC115970348 n=1 Tax=Quercus lobata TaxID=97700 RepID=UPI001243ADE9|nr:uncharacterized protein LOC115970348 [Quercus lobata]